MADMGWYDHPRPSVRSPGTMAATATARVGNIAASPAKPDSSAADEKAGESDHGQVALTEDVASRSPVSSRTAKVRRGFSFHCLQVC